MQKMFCVLWKWFQSCGSVLFSETDLDDCLLVRALRPLFFKGISGSEPSRESRTAVPDRTLFAVRFPQVLKFSQFELPFDGSAVRAPPQNA